MEYRPTLLGIIFGLIITICIAVEEASFYGNSYISLSFKEAKSSTDIRFKFRTYLSNALLLLVAGSTDYCIVRLENSRIKININLGAGESELLSQNSVKLNDFKWHEVSIIRRDSDLSMMIDRTHRVQKHLPGKFFELNIHYGLFVGGHGNFTEIFFGHVDKYRGCLSELEYNGIMILETARLRKSQSIVKGVTWNCAAEFAATLNHPISFVEDDAYMVVSQSTPHKEFEIQFEIKTISSEGLLFYNSGKATKPDFFVIEVWKSNIRCLVRGSETLLSIVSDEYISDGNWHKVYLHFYSSLAEVIVDGKIKQEKNKHSQVFDFSDSSYVGGLEVSKRSRAMSKGCQFCDTSFKGCIRNLIITGRQTGLPDVYVSEGLLPGCMWHYPCFKNPCKADRICLQQGLNSFTCKCQDDMCTNSNYTDSYKVFSQNSLATDLELLSIQPLTVLEGQSTIITTYNLYMILDYQKYGIKESGIHFYITEGPTDGNIVIDIWPHEKNMFTLEDVALDKVHYIHEGSENHADYVMLDIEFSPVEPFILPIYLQGRFRFTLSVTVIPVNDPPILNIPNTSVLRMVQGTKITLSPDLFHIEDPDNTAAQLVFNVIKASSGHFEYAKKSGTTVSSFTQEELENHQVLFVHHDDDASDSYVSFQVSDGIEMSTVARLRISVSPEYWRLENNTGLVLLHQTAAVVTPYNLSFVSNVPNIDYKLQFFIVKKPHYGSIELEKNINLWEPSETFTSSDVMQHRVRYHHVKSKPEFDEFQFRTSFNKSAIYTFRLNFVKCRLYSTRSNKILMNETWETSVTDQHVFFKTKPISTTTLTYVILQPPKYGYLFSSVSKYHLKACDVFTQEDILLKNVKYKFFQKPYSVIEDYFTFIVLSPGCSNKTENFSISYYPSDILKSKIQIILAPLHIKEGGYASIDSKHLFITAEFLSDLNFNITQKPRNGMLQVVNNNVTNHDVSYFTLSDIKNGNLIYIHDDSETVEDLFIFIALSREDDRFQYVGTFTIEVQLKNDNSLVRTVEKIFHVVVGGERLLTSDYLKYTDADIDTKPSDIVYTYRETVNGNFYNIHDPGTKISEFTQEDIDNNRVLFKHKGPEFAKVRLWVTDGQFHVNGILEIQASAPFIHLLTNHKLIVQQGKMAAITSNHLTFSTNLFTFNENVLYEVVTKPTFGKIVHSKSLKVVNNFTHSDIIMGRISYLNDISSGNADEIGIRIRCKDAVDVAQLSILILPSSYWKPLYVKKHDILSVEESTSALITKTILEVVQESIPSSSITYYIHEGPKNGYLALLTTTDNTGDDRLVTSFTQNLINEDRVLYIQSGINKTKDEIVFNVTNGIVWYNKLKLRIVIIPEHLYLGSSNITVNEGGVATFTDQNLYVSTDFYKFKVTDYVILQDAGHGCIQVQEKCNKFSFSQKDLMASIVTYAHDGSENLLDEITVVAIAGKKRSIPTTVFINILPVNDHEPQLRNNTGLTMWEGGIATITNAMLAATDEDQPAEIINYEIHGCWLGSLVLSSNTSKSITRFTQEALNNNLVAFKHQNGTKAKFIFVVSDGQHTTKEYTFHIRTKSVQLKLYKKSLELFPLQKKYITSDYLLSHVSDPQRIIIYEVIKAPTLGRLMMEFKSAGIFSVVSTFTQEDINSSRIFYEHTHQFTDFYSNDSFVFNVKSHLAQTIFNQLFKVDVSISSGGLNSYITIPKISVNEGDTTNIFLNLSGVVSFLENYAGVKSPIIHASATKPQHGQIFLRHKDNLTTFTQAQLESGQVYYEHDHSDTLEDYIQVALYLIPGYVSLCNISVPISINPINDQPFKLVTENPSLTVVQGENHTITKDELNTEDKDTPPSLIKYVVISEPSQGRLVLLPEICLPVLYFTQADINDKRLLYIHNSSVLSDSFHFRVSDDMFRPQFTIFNVKVLAVSLNVTVGVPIYLKQGSDMVFLTEKQFNIKTNSNMEKIMYLVIREPKHGVFYVRNTPSLSFNHLDLKSDNVMYLQTDMTAANDSFRVQTEITLGNTSVGNSVDLEIKVQPLMHLRNFTAIAGEKTRIALHSMDATPLAKLTDSNPRYTIINMTKYFLIRKIIRSTGERKSVLDVVVNIFTHEEVQSGLIYLEVASVSEVHGESQGYILFMLSASIFQPAYGELIVHVKMLPVNEVHSTLAGPSDPAGHEGGFSFTSPGMTKDYFLIVSMVFGIIVLGVTVIIIIKCRSLESDELNKQDQCLQSMPLSHATDSLISPPQPLLKHIDGYGTSIPPTLPHCKVTPLSKNESETHTLYPYGAEDHQEDWSSCEASETQCPSKSIMLRRNQYWV